MELSGSRQPPGSLGASRTLEVSGCEHLILVENEARREEDAVVLMGLRACEHGGERL